MAATFTPLEGAFANGTYALDDILVVLSHAGELTESGTVETEYGNLSITVADGKATQFLYYTESANALYLTGLSIDFATLQAAVTAADGGDGSFEGLYAAFSGIDYKADFSKLNDKVYAAFGMGGDDVYEMSKYDDSYYMDGGNDRIAMNGGNDFIGILQLPLASGKTVVNGGSGTDLLSLEADVTRGMVIDLTKTVNTIRTVEGSFKLELKSVENLVGSFKGDRLLGTSGTNMINGISGDDVITGRGGADTLYGGLGSDDFVYLSVKDSGKKSKADTIADFEVKLDDIDLSALDPANKKEKFVFIGDNDFSKKAGQLRFEQFDKDGTDRDYTLVQADLNGDRKVDFEIRLTGLIDLHKGDFIL